MEILNEKALKRKYDRLITDAEVYVKGTNRKGESLENWKKTEKAKFDQLFDISEASSTPATPLKRKSEEMVRIFSKYSLG